MNPDIFLALAKAIGEGVVALEDEYAKAVEEKLPSLKTLSELAAQLTPDHAAYQALTTTLNQVRQEVAGVPHDIYLAYASLVQGLESDVGGIANFVHAHHLAVHPAFIRTVEAAGLPPILPASEPIAQSSPEPIKPSKSKKVVSNEESGIQEGSQESGTKAGSQERTQEG